VRYEPRPYSIWSSPDPTASLDRLCEAALYGQLVHYPNPSIRPDRVSSVRVFGKSLHMLAAGWAAAVTWLWFAALQQAVNLTGVIPADYALHTVAVGVVCGLALEAVAMIVVRFTGGAPLRVLQREEWRHAFWWSLVPNVLLLATAYLMVRAAM
jgi:hypothetical protein